MNTRQSIANLEKLSVALSRAANSPRNYNSQFAIYLEQMSWEMQKSANELRDLEYLIDDTTWKEIEKVS